MANNRGRNRGRKRDRGPKHKINDKIRYPEVRVVEGIDTGIYDTSEALREAEDLGLDLVLITENAKPPVCKVIDYKKFLYEEKKKQKEQEKNQIKVVVKEVRLSPNIGDHDFDVVKKRAHGFLEDGNKVKVTLRFKGRNIVFKERGEEVMLRFADELSEVGVPESMPKLQNRQMIFTIKPKKKK